MFSLDKNERNLDYCFKSIALLILVHNHWVEVPFTGLLSGFLSFQQ